MTDNDLLPLLERRLLGLYSPLLADTAATILLTAGGMANWTVHIKNGRASATRGGPPHPTTTVRAALSVLTEVVSGQRSGIQAFLDQLLTVRGDLALALQMDGLFPGDVEDDSRTYTRSVRATGIDTFYLESGPVDAPPSCSCTGSARPTRRCCRSSLPCPRTSVSSRRTCPATAAPRRAAPPRRAVPR